MGTIFQFLKIKCLLFHTSLCLALVVSKKNSSYLVIKLLKKTLWSLFMDGVQLPQGYSHFEEAVYFLPFSSQKFLVLILLTSEGWKAESTLEPPNGFEHGTAGLGIQHLNQYSIFFVLDFVQFKSILKHYWCADVFVSQAYSSTISKFSYAHKNCIYPGNLLHVHNFHK